MAVCSTRAMTAAISCGVVDDELLGLAEPAIAALREAQAEACGGPLPG